MNIFICPSRFPCRFKQFGMDGTKCSLEESLPGYVIASCAKPWNINVLKWTEIGPNKWIQTVANERMQKHD
jgi:hypothetical protein